MEKQDKRPRWTTVVRRGKVAPQRETPAPRKRPLPDSEALQRPPPTVLANASSSEQWAAHWPLLPNSPNVARRAGIETVTQNDCVEPPQRLEEARQQSAMSASTDAEDSPEGLVKSLEDTASHGKGEPQAAACELENAERQQEQRRELAALASLSNKIQQPQLLQNANLKFSTVNIVCSNPRFSTAERGAAASVFNYSGERAAPGELIHAAQFVLKMLEAKTRRDEFMKRADEVLLTTPHRTLSNEKEGTDQAATVQSGDPDSTSYPAGQQHASTKGELASSTLKQELQECQIEETAFIDFIPHVLHAFRAVIRRSAAPADALIYQQVMNLEGFLVNAAANSVSSGGSESTEHLKAHFPLGNRSAQQLSVQHLNEATTHEHSTLERLDRKHQEFIAQQKELSAQRRVGALACSSIHAPFLVIPSQHPSHSTRLQEILLHPTFPLLFNGQKALKQVKTDGGSTTEEQWMEAQQEGQKDIVLENHVLHRTHKKELSINPIQRPQSVRSEAAKNAHSGEVMPADRNSGHPYPRLGFSSSVDIFLGPQLDRSFPGALDKNNNQGLSAFRQHYSQTVNTCDVAQAHYYCRRFAPSSEQPDCLQDGAPPTTLNASEPSALHRIAGFPELTASASVAKDPFGHVWQPSLHEFQTQLCGQLQNRCVRQPMSAVLLRHDESSEEWSRVNAKLGEGMPHQRSLQHLHSLLTIPSPAPVLAAGKLQACYSSWFWPHSLANLFEQNHISERIEAGDPIVANQQHGKPIWDVHNQDAADWANCKRLFSGAVSPSHLHDDEFHEQDCSMSTQHSRDKELAHLTQSTGDVQLSDDRCSRKLPRAQWERLKQLRQLSMQQREQRTSQHEKQQPGIQLEVAPRQQQQQRSQKNRQQQHKPQQEQKQPQNTQVAEPLRV
ncbi:hypothetical protein, conserved [Eimeria tenella]|uniref:Uncharacterized protein n=1 Tax=Eimeria tenella TaxID=5802 RepID=U6KVY7_EIMTE|nr:hypothetical protein, conserved [Eimeria tenella]CDJ42302.1 hypothetical protein, conserved [Eimeria tenella]|eukprot:XP_013233052.1 hypothetical protein, conserved [Eimeria tenella]